MRGDKEEASMEDLAREASRWMSRLEKSGQHNQVAFGEWLREDPQHVREFLEVTWLDVELQRLLPDGDLEIMKLIQELRAESGVHTASRIMLFPQSQAEPSASHSAGRLDDECQDIEKPAARVSSRFW